MFVVIPSDFIIYVMQPLARKLWLRLGENGYSNTALDIGLMCDLGQMPCFLSLSLHLFLHLLIAGTDICLLWVIVNPSAWNAVSMVRLEWRPLNLQLHADLTRSSSRNHNYLLLFLWFFFFPQNQLWFPTLAPIKSLGPGLGSRHLRMSAVTLLRK